ESVAGEAAGLDGFEDELLTGVPPLGEDRDADHGAEEEVALDGGEEGEPVAVTGRRRERPRVASLHEREHSTRRDRRRRLHSVPTKVAQSIGVRTLTPEQRVSLFGPGMGEEHIQATMTGATTGVAVLACQHIARRLTQDADAKKLSRRDIMALRMAPQISAEVRKSVPAGEPQPQGAHDPITALLNASGRTQEIVRAENKT